MPSKLSGWQIRPVAGLLLAAVTVVLKRPLHVARDEQIEAAVVVVVEEAGARAPAAARDTGPARHVAERTVTVVAIQRVAAVVGDVEIVEAVVVVVANGHAHAVAVLRHARDARLLADVDERAVGRLVIQPVPERGIGLVRLSFRWHRVVDLRAVGEEDVEASVVVVVQQRYATAHRLDQVLVRRGGIPVREGNPRCLCRVGKLHAGGGRARDHQQPRSAHRQAEAHGCRQA